jgi:hypothetical protein
VVFDDLSLHIQWKIGKFCVAATQICVIFNTSFCVMTGFSIQSLSFCNTKISTQTRIQHKSDFERKSFKSVRTYTSIILAISNFIFEESKIDQPGQIIGG